MKIGLFIPCCIDAFFPEVGVTTLFMVKAILSGRGEEVIDLARSNLWR